MKNCGLRLHYLRYGLSEEFFNLCCVCILTKDVRVLILAGNSENAVHIKQNNRSGQSLCTAHIWVLKMDIMRRVYFEDCAFNFDIPYFCLL